MDGLISKKEILERYNISYGTLYRWKRMGLIPDEWLIKKSTFTGQETFFNEEQICERIEAIIKRKDEVPLEQIARELLNKSKDEQKLLIETRYWSREVNLAEVLKITIRSDGGEIDVTDSVLKFSENREQPAKNLGGVGIIKIK